jgi:hypothetical protein
MHGGADMIERERLIEILSQPIFPKIGVDPAEVVADYLLDNGVIVPPCKVGDKAYHLTSVDTLDELNVAEIFEGKVSSVSIEDKVWIFCRYDNGLNFWYTESDFGKTVFLTREEAEKALAERSENGK